MSIFDHLSPRIWLKRLAALILSVPALLRRDWRIATVAAVGFAGVIVIISFSNRLAENLRAEGRAFAKIYKETMLITSNVDNPSLILGIMANIQALNEYVPVVLVDSQTDSIAESRNLTPNDSLASYQQKERVFNVIRHTCDSVPLPEVDQVLFYGESNFVSNVATIRAIEVLLFIVFGSGLFFVLRWGFRRERDSEFRGISKEYAHQLGTPLQSLMGCYDLLAEGADPSEVLDELNGDIERLAEVSERLQRQGDGLKLKNVPLNPDLAKVADYIRVRTSRHIQVDFLEPDGIVAAPHDATLFRWAVENICKNAADAIGHRPGRIAITLRSTPRKAVIEIADNGRGMTPDTKVRIFDSGFSTKEKGWGVGLALVRRIIVAGHKGDVFVDSTQPGVGTTFKIILNKK